MKSKLLLNILFITFLLSSCGYRRLLADKRYIVQDVKGYLVFTDIDVVFYPYKDTIDAHFLADKHKAKGYKIGYDTYWMDSLSTDYSDLLYFKNDTKLSIIPVEVRYYLGSTWEKEDEYGSINYKWKEDTFELPYRYHDWRSIIHIVLLRKRDEERAEKLDIPREPPHYRQFSSDWPGVNY